jgi:hypothetical protein
MNFFTHNHAKIDIQHTSLQGTIQATPGQLRTLFGAPVDRPSDRSFMVWEIQFKDGQVATIYDWNRTQVPHIDDVIAWHIGGRDARVVELVHATFRERLGMMRSAA